VTDHTKNRSGPANRTQPLTLRKCSNQALIDGMIADGWIAQEDRDREVIALYQGQAAAENRKQMDRYERRQQEAYRAGWIERWIKSQEEMERS
jgi:hypothetical protein